MENRRGCSGVCPGGSPLHLGPQKLSLTRGLCSGRWKGPSRAGSKSVDRGVPSLSPPGRRKPSPRPRQVLAARAPWGEGRCAPQLPPPPPRSPVRGPREPLFLVGAAGRVVVGVVVEAVVGILRAVEHRGARGATAELPPPPRRPPALRVCAEVLAAGTSGVCAAGCSPPELGSWASGVPHPPPPRPLASNPVAGEAPAAVRAEEGSGAGVSVTLRPGREAAGARWVV